jgi:hypothetical protein
MAEFGQKRRMRREASVFGPAALKTSSRIVIRVGFRWFKLYQRALPLIFSKHHDSNEQSAASI